MIIVSAPAKINFSLRILGKRADGYHELESVMQLVSLADKLIISEADTLQFTCSEPQLETADNLVLRAARLLQKRSSRTGRACIHLEKLIPTQAGLGGGSSDAASTLLALNDFWKLGLSLPELIKLAASLGSDVPFFLGAPCALVRGRGEKVTPIVHNTPGNIVLVKPAEGLSTPRVYADLHAANIDEPIPAQGAPATMALLKALMSGHLADVAREVFNNLEAPAFLLLPELARLRAKMLAEGCLSVLLCGSGSSLFGICRTAEEAANVALILSKDDVWTWAGEWLMFRASI